MSPRYDPDRIRERLCATRLKRVFRVIHDSHRSQPLEAIPSASRFSDPAQQYAVLYAAESVRCGFWEAIVRNRLVHHRRREIPRLEVESRLVVSLYSQRNLLLLDLRGDGSIRIDAPPAVVHDTNHAAGRALSAAVYEHVPEADGFLYQSRFTGHNCVAIFDRSFENLAVSRITPLVEHMDFLDALVDYDIMLTKRPG